MVSLITGGAGFIGAEVVRILLEKSKMRTVVFSRSPSSGRLDDVADRVELIQGDLGNFSHVLDAVKKVRPDVIFHMGAILSVPSDANPATAFRTNAMGTFHVLEAARLFDVPKVLFSSSIGTYGLDIHDEVINDATIQRPLLFYGVTKVFGEQMGLFYKRKHGLDFRGVRYPSVIGPGVQSPGAVQYTSWVIEECAKGNPYTIWVKPETRVPVLYIKDAAQAILKLAEAPLENIQTGIYLLDGVKPTPSAGELADVVRNKVPGAQIGFTPDEELQSIVESLRRLDDGNARREWGWNPAYDLERIVDDFLLELKRRVPRGSITSSMKVLSK